MKILINWVGPWLDKGEAAMIISMVKALRERIPNVSITAMPSSFQPQEIDIIKYSEYDLKVLPGIFPNIFSVVPKLKFLKFKVLKAMIALPVFLAMIVKNMLWLLLYRILRIDAGFLIGNNKDTVKEYRDADWIIFCGGQYIINLNLVALYEIIFSKMLGKPVMIWANSLGPFNPKYIRPFVKWVLNKVNLITTREATSKKILDDIGVTAPTFVTADAAFTLPVMSKEEVIAVIEDGTGIPKDELMVGVTAIPWNFPGEKGDVKSSPSSSQKQEPLPHQFLDPTYNLLQHRSNQFLSSVHSLSQS